MSFAYKGSHDPSAYKAGIGCRPSSQTPNI